MTLIFTADCLRHPIQMAGVETIWELHTLPVINSCANLIVCVATSCVTPLLNPLFYLFIVCMTCITLGLTFACNHADRVSDQM